MPNIINSAVFVKGEDWIYWVTAVYGDVVELDFCRLVPVSQIERIAA